jgi:hypothetical protein
MDFFQSHKLCPSRCYLTFFHIPERSIALVKRLVHQGLKLIPTCPNKHSKVHTHSYIHGWTSFSRTTVPKPLLSYLLLFERSIALVKRLAGSPKGWNWSTCPTLTKCYSKVAHAFLYIDGLLSVAPNCAQAVAILPSSIFERSIALVKRLAGSQKGWNWSHLPHANKVLLKVAHAFLYTLMDFFQSHQTVPNCYLTFFHFPERSIALVKRLAGSPKGWNWSQPAPR